MTGKELSAVLAECAARTEIARAGIEVAREKQEEAIARQEAVTAEIQKLRPQWEKERAEREKERGERENERAEFWKGFEESRRKTDVILAELKEARDERRAMIEALFRMMDRLDNRPPPPPHLRSV